MSAQYAAGCAPHGCVFVAAPLDRVNVCCHRPSADTFDGAADLFNKVKAHSTELSRGALN